MRDNILKTATTVAAAIALAGCVHPVNTNTPTPTASQTSTQLPTIFAGQVFTGSTGNPTPVESTNASQPNERRITVTASNADVRELLPAIAAAGGINMVMSPDVHGHVSVRFIDVPVSQALKAVIAEAGLTTGTGQLESPWAPVIFHGTSVNVNVASAQLISARFGVSEQLARVIVESRDAIDKNW